MEKANNTSLPQQGIFWFIDDNLVSFAETIDPDNFVEFGAMNHQDTWRQIRSKYLREGKLVEYDYYPRGRVIVCPTFDDDSNITGYDCLIYADPCINEDPLAWEQIEQSFNLNQESCNISYEGDYSTDNTHYTCTYCRTREELSQELLDDIVNKVITKVNRNLRMYGRELRCKKSYVVDNIVTIETIDNEGSTYLVGIQIKNTIPKVLEYKEGALIDHFTAAYSESYYWDDYPKWDILFDFAKKVIEKTSEYIIDKDYWIDWEEIYFEYDNEILNLNVKDSLGGSFEAYIPVNYEHFMSSSEHRNQCIKDFVDQITDAYSGDEF